MKKLNTWHFFSDKEKLEETQQRKIKGGIMSSYNDTYVFKAHYSNGNSFRMNPYSCRPKKMN